MKIHDYVRAGDIEGVKAELASGVSIDAIEEETGMTPYDCMFENMNVEMMYFIHEQGAFPTYTAPVEEEKTELELAVRAGNIEKTRQLLDEGTDIHQVRKGGYDILISAVYASVPLELIQLLIERGVKVDGLSSYNESALREASRRGRFDSVKVILAAGGPPEYLQWTELMHTIVFGSLDEVQQLINSGADLTARDNWDRTPLLLAIHVGEIDKVELLLKHGANRDDRGRCGQHPLSYPIETGNATMLRWLIDAGFDIEERGLFENTALMTAAEYGNAEAVKILLDAGVRLDTLNQFNQRAISVATSLEVVRVLIGAGEDWSDISDEMRAELLGFQCEGTVETTEAAFLKDRVRRFGIANPEKMESPFWEAMVRSGTTAYNPRSQFEDADQRMSNGPVWCYKRFGKSLTELPDGRFIEIAGEHEDHYDPDFCIYNDVFVHHGDGKFDIYGYPREVFQPTDFHSATLVGQYIYIIGCLGYPEDRREGQTPVYRLDTATFAIEAVKTSGENPGWIFKHRAVYHDGAGILVSDGEILKRKRRHDNEDHYLLDLETMKWRKL